MSGDLGATGLLLAYYAVVLFVIPVGAKAATRIPDEVVRKFQHVGYALSIFLVLELFQGWPTALLANALLAVVAYPVLAVWEGRAGYQELLTDRSERGGELRLQMLYVQLTFALLVVGLWGLVGPATKPVIAAAVMAWGLGDAAAALVGTYAGSRSIRHPAVERSKTVEGTAAMIVVAVVAIALTLAWYGQVPWSIALAVAVVAGPVAGFIELVSRDGVDTVTVPLGTAVTLMALLVALSVIGVNGAAAGA